MIQAFSAEKILRVVLWLNSEFYVLPAAEEFSPEKELEVQDLLKSSFIPVLFFPGYLTGQINNCPYAVSA